MSASAAPMSQSDPRSSQPAVPKPRIAVVTAFLDKAYGTERTVIEWLSHMPDAFEIHVYSQRVEDLDAQRFMWHRIPALPGPGLLSFIWWFAVNHLRRAWDRYVRGLRYDFVYSPGINCFDADVISVRIVFAEFLRQAGDELAWSRVPLGDWPRLLHRKLYYRLIVALERRIYSDPKTMLVLYAKKTARDLERFYGRRDRLPVLYLGLDDATFNPARRAMLREGARRELGLAVDQFAVLLVGNDLRKKRIAVLLEAMGKMGDLPVRLLLAGREDPAPFEAMAGAAGVAERVQFLPARKDVDFYYAAADAYAGPSLEDPLCTAARRGDGVRSARDRLRREWNLRSHFARRGRHDSERCRRRRITRFRDSRVVPGSRIPRASRRESRRNRAAIHLGTQRPRPGAHFRGRHAAQGTIFRAHAPAGVVTPMLRTPAS